MSEIWNELRYLKDTLIDEFDLSGTKILEPGMERFNQPGWINLVWTSDIFRRAHIDVVDARDTKGLWMMHCCVFPHLDDPSPIFGLDVIAGRNKITGFFHDWSPTTDPNDGMIEIFGFMTDKLIWKKSRDLPDWAKRIFSQHMIAAGNINETRELEQLVDFSKSSIRTYLSYIGSDLRDEKVDSRTAQQFYCDNQKQNPHTPKVMASLGLDEDDVRVFIEECLFPHVR
jgi:hypothetical protein